MRIFACLNHPRVISVLVAALVALASPLLVALSAPSAPATPVAQPDDGWVFGVGHNSGRALAANEQALVHGADIVEIDVRSLQGRLISAHYPVLTVGNLSFFQGPTVEEVWDASVGADAVLLDLKESSEFFVQLVIAFLKEHEGEHQVLVASPDPATLERLVGVSRDVALFQSVHDRHTLAGLVAEQSPCALIGGVTVRHDLLDATSIDLLHAAGLLVFAWTVNDPLRADELIRFGVDGIITDNLQILESLRGSRHAERSLLAARASLAPSTAACA